MSVVGQTTVPFLNGFNKKSYALAGSNGVATSQGVTLFDINGVPIGTGNAIPTADAAAEAALALIQVNTASAAAALGTPSDSPYPGSGNGTGISLLKAIAEGGGGTLLGKVQIQGATSTNILVVNTDGSVLSFPEATCVTTTPSLTAGQTNGLTLDTSAALRVNGSAGNGQQGTGSQFNPPAGGVGNLGYLSGILAAVSGTLTVGLAAGVQAVGTVLVGAGSATIGAVRQAGSWFFTPTPRAVTSNLYANQNVTTGTTVVNPGTPATVFLEIRNQSAAGGVTLTFASGATLWLARAGAPGSWVRWEGTAVPSEGVTATADSGTAVVTIGAA